MRKLLMHDCGDVLDLSANVGEHMATQILDSSGTNASDPTLLEE